MAARSKGRGAAAAIGLFVLFAGLVGGGVLYVVAQQRPSQTIDGFAEAPIGCDTILEFETGSFFVFEEVGATRVTVEHDCSPVATPAGTFAAEFTDEVERVTYPLPESVVADDSVSYDTDGVEGRSVLRVEITEPGEYALAVTGSDLSVIGALGRDPDEGAGNLRRAALATAIAGIVLGLALLTISARRSKQAAVMDTSDSPVRDEATTQPTGRWQSEPPDVDQVHMNPSQPVEPARTESSERVMAVSSTWAPPTGDAEPLPPPGVDDEDEPAQPDTPEQTPGT